MKMDIQLLSALLLTAQEEQIGIRSALEASTQPEFRATLQAQLREFGTIETEVHTIASQRGWELRDIQPGRRAWMRMQTRMKLDRCDDSGIAELLIHRNTKAMIGGLKALHRSGQQDHRVSILSQRLLDCESAAIQQLQPFL